MGICVRRPTLEAKRGSRSSTLLLAPDGNPRPSKLRVLRGRGEKGPLQAGTARRHIWNCELGPSSGPWGQGGAAVGQPEGGEDPQRDPGARSPRMGGGLGACGPLAGAGRARRMVLRWGRRWGASVSATRDPGRLGAESGRPTTPAREQLGRRRRPRRWASSASPAFQPRPEAGGWDAGGRVRDSGPLLGLLQPPQSLLTPLQGP